MYLSSGEMPIDQTPTVCPVRVKRAAPVLTSQSLHVLSREAEAKTLLSDEKERLVIASPWPARVWRHVLVLTFQSLVILSYDPDAIILPSGDHARDLNPFLCPVRGVGEAPVSRSQSPDDLIIGHGGKELAIRRKRHGVDWGIVVLEYVDCRPGHRQIILGSS